MEYAYEGDELRGEGQPSVFTEAVVEGLETGKADLDHDQLVSVDDLYNYVYDRVKQSTPSQTPSRKSDLEGPLYLAKSDYRPEVQPARLDSDLLARTEDRYAGIRQGAVQELAILLSSSDPAVALAARHALSSMVDDDSRQVSASAQAALAAADRVEIDDREGEPDGIRHASTLAENAAATEREESVPPAVERLGDSAAPRSRQRTARRLTRRVRVAIPLAVTAVAAAAAILLWPDEGPDRGATPVSASESRAVPKANPCEAAKTGWTIKALGAEEHYRCQLKTSPPPDRLGEASLVYAVFSNADQARKSFERGLGFEYDGGAKPCRPSTERNMAAAYRQGLAECLVAEQWVAIWWNDDRSAVLGIIDFALPTKPEDAAKAWSRVISAK